MRVFNVVQRSPEWKKLRLGVITASNADNTLYASRSKPYYYQLLAEVLSGNPTEIAITAPMQWGMDHENEARDWYVAKTGTAVEEIGFCKPDDKNHVGCSPDGLVGTDGLIEIKCPGTKTHIANLHGEVSLSYRNQMQFQMWITGRDWCDFVSYDPRLPEQMRGFIKRFPRDEKRIETIAKACQDMYDKITAFCGKYYIAPYG